MRTRCLFLIVAVLLKAAPARAQEIGVDFLRMGTNAAGQALGDQGVAFSRDAFSTYWNPAGLAAAPGSVGASHHIWLNGVRAYNVTGRVQVGPHGGAGLFVTALAGGTGGRVEEVRDGSGSADIQSAAVGVAYGHQFGPVRVGATAKYVSVSYTVFNLSGLAADFGAQADLFGGTVRLGAALQDVGRLRQESTYGLSLPTTWRVGAAVFPLTIYAADDDAPLVRAFVTGEVSRDRATTSQESPGGPDATHVHLGAGTEWFDLVTLRAGYVSGYDTRAASLGLGIGSGPFQIDYALIPFQAGYGTGHVLTLLYAW